MVLSLTPEADEALRRALGHVLRNGKTVVDLFIETRSSVAVNLENGVVRESAIRETRGAGMRRLCNDDWHYVSTTDVSAHGLEALLARAAGRESTAARVPEIAFAATPGDALADPATLLAALDAADRAARSTDGSIRYVSVMVEDTLREIVVVRPDAPIVRDRRRFTVLGVRAIAQRERKARRAFRSCLGESPQDCFGDGKPSRTAQEAAEAAVRRLESVPVPVGEMTVVLGPGSPAALIHEACGHGLEADQVDAGTSPYRDMGARVASPLINIADDPTPGRAAIGAYCIDDEGTPAQRVDLIDRGYLRNWLYDEHTARKHGRSSNSHGRRPSFLYPPLPRMATTMVCAGDDDPDEIIASTPRGLFVTTVGDGRVDWATGAFALQVTEGYLIEGGRITAPIRGAVIAGQGSQVLQTIDRVGCDFRLHVNSGGCVKGGQAPLPVSFGQPTLRVPRLLVWGGE